VILWTRRAPMNVRYRVELEDGERQPLRALVAGGSRAVRRIKRA
jgi:hypothetical protein